MDKEMMVRLWNGT